VRSIIGCNPGCGRAARLEDADLARVDVEPSVVADLGETGAGDGTDIAVPIIVIFIQSTQWND
jgi:hypothetical protein